MPGICYDSRRDSRIQGICNRRKGEISFPCILPDLQTYLKGKKAHIDTRGVTTSFDGFTGVVGEFVKEPFNIRRINEKDIAEWQSSSDNSHEEHLALAEAVIKANIECNKIN